MIDLDRYPLHKPDSAADAALLAEKRHDWQNRGACQLSGLIRPMMAVLSYMEEPGYFYSQEDRLRFYGRPAPDAPPVHGAP